MSEEPITIQGEYLVNVYSKAIQPRRQRICSDCLTSLKKAWEKQKDTDVLPIDDLDVDPTIILKGTCQRCGVVL